MVSIMVDPLAELQEEARARGITGIVASDPDKHVSEQYEAMDASMHPGVKPGHTFVLVLKGGQTSWRWDWFGHGKPMYMEVNDIYDNVQKGVSRGS
jgi:hypothetical protein